MPRLPRDLFAKSAAKRAAMRRIPWADALHAGQREVDASTAEIVVLACGRRWGKTYWAVRKAVEVALATGRTVLWVALTYKVAKNAVWPYITRTVPAGYRRLHESRMRVELLGGGAIQIGSLDLPDNLRGLGTDVVLIVVDEAAFVRDYDVENVLDPMRLDNAARLLMLSSPNGQRGVFYRYFLMGQNPAQEAIRSFQMPTASNPCLPRVEAMLAEKRKRIPELVFRQEYLAEFVDNAGQVFRGVRLCALAARQLDSRGRPLVRAGVDYYAGIDFARTGADYTVVTVLERAADGGLRLAWLDRWGREEDRAQVDRIGAILNRFRPVRTLAEENSFGGVYVSWLREEYDVRVELFQTTAGSKGPLVLQGAAVFEGGRIEIWPEDDELGGVLIDELSSYERTVSDSGHVAYAAPAGLHDDLVMSLLLAVRAADGDPDGEDQADDFGSNPERYLVREGALAPAQPRWKKLAAGLWEWGWR